MCVSVFICHPCAHLREQKGSYCIIHMTLCSFFSLLLSLCLRVLAILLLTPNKPHSPERSSKKMNEIIAKTKPKMATTTTKIMNNPNEYMERML